uniref:Uncharacterized protein MANES_13G137500 n=1 Tax=Rhizophora mucronata TaxID=61149 RepID=A0A2P2LGZ2_RHIMU
MTDFEGGRYDGNGSDFDNSFAPGGGSSHQPRTNSHGHGGSDDYSDSKSLVSAVSTLTASCFLLSDGD